MPNMLEILIGMGSHEHLRGGIVYYCFNFRKLLLVRPRPAFSVLQLAGVTPGFQIPGNDGGSFPDTLVPMQKATFSSAHFRGQMASVCSTLSAQISKHVIPPLLPYCGRYLRYAGTVGVPAVFSRPIHILTKSVFKLQRMQPRSGKQTSQRLGQTHYAESVVL